MEVALTQRDAAKRAWPADLPATVDALVAVFDGFVAQLATSPALAGPPAAKIKAVADAVWSKLNKGSYSKDLQHAQVGGALTTARLAAAPGQSYCSSYRTNKVLDTFPVRLPTLT